MKELLSYLKLQKSLGLDDRVLVENKKNKINDIHELRSWDSLQKEALACQRCALSKTRTQVVFGSGNLKSKLVFVGEAPGFEEDKQGLPFVGRAGELLTKIIEAMGYERKDVFIANIIKCRPPNNRNPSQEEIDFCKPYLLEQLAHLQPKVICALGTFAAQTLLETDQKISRLRGQFHDFQGIKVMPTFHPAYLLRNPSSKREVWMDVQKIIEELKS